MDPLAPFGPATRAWFEDAFQAATPVQARGWATIAEGRHSLLTAPTGSGKTLAAFLWALDGLTRADRPAAGARVRPGPDDGPARGVRTLYVSPLKALVYDVERNLRAPLAGIGRAAARLGVDHRAPRVAVRTGDTPQKERQAQARDPAEIFVTTPESLYLVLLSQARETLRTVETVILDEIHALAPTKRGAHLGLSLERLSALVRAAGGADPQRIGLSATARPLETVAQYLGGDRDVAIVDTSQPPAMDLTLVVPVPRLDRPGELPEAGATASAPAAAPGGSPLDDDELGYEVDEGFGGEGGEGGGGSRDLLDDWGGPVLGEVYRQARARAETDEPRSVWPSVYARLLEAIDAHRSTLVFVNSRGLCERLAQKLNELSADERHAQAVARGEADPESEPVVEEVVRAHHGSLAHARRKETEELLKGGGLAAIVATSSLELGIDMATVDLVVMVSSPGSVMSGLQRIGRAGHGVGEVSRGLLFPKHQGDLLEATVLARRMRAGEVEPLKLPRNPLDVLAQQIVAWTVTEDVPVAELEACIRRAAAFRELPRDALVGVLDMLSGRYPSNAFADLRPRVVWDREADVLRARRGSRALAAMSGGTIPDRGLYAVHLGGDGPRVGELDEEMVHESRPGHVIFLGASSWRIQEITRDRVIVQPAPGEPGRLPFWRGEGPGRPVELGRALGGFIREADEKLRAAGRDGSGGRAEPPKEWLRDTFGLDDWAADNLVRYLREQREATGTVPTDRAITVERFRDELGDERVCILSPFGSRVHAPWALALEHLLTERAGFDVQVLHSDDGLVLRFVDADERPELDALVPDPDAVEELVLEQVGRSALFATHFRENAARALLLPRRRPGQRTPLWAQRLKAQNLLAVARGFPSFPIVLETYRSCLQDVFDLPALRAVLGAIQRREIRVDVVDTPSASPFARSLVFEYVAAYLYEGDTPLAERRAQALALDRTLLRELLGHEELRELLDGDVLDEVEAELQRVADDRRARHPDHLQDVLRELGALTTDEVEARTDGDGARWLAELSAQRRAFLVRIAGEARWMAAEDAGHYRDALGTPPPPSVPQAFLDPVPDAVEQLVARYARTRGPFLAESLAQRYGLATPVVLSALEAMSQRGAVLEGAFRPGGEGREWCDPDVLRRLRRRTLARLRGEVAPVEPDAYSRFLVGWHGVDAPGRGDAALEDALVQLEGLPLAFRDLEDVILPSRVRDYSPAMLDELGAAGQLVWVGAGALGKSDGRVALYQRDRLATLANAWPPLDTEEARAEALEAALGDRTDPRHEALVAALRQAGACFFDELVDAAKAAGLGQGRREDVLEALWDLVWAGLVTNDTLAPLRRLGPKPKSRREARRGGFGRRGFAARARTSAPPTAVGRWSLVSTVAGATGERDAKTSDGRHTARAHGRALTLLERHGVVGRRAFGAEAFEGGFGPVYQVLRAMEEQGQVRRGYFVDGLGGAQFAYAGVVDRLRGARTPASQRDPDAEGKRSLHVVLAATDPANPFGAVLEWPAPPTPLAEGTEGDRPTPKRASGARVVLVDGQLAAWLDKSGRNLLTWQPLRQLDPDGLREAVRAMRRLTRGRRGRMMRVERVDGEPAIRSVLAGRLREAGFAGDHRGLVLEG